MSSEKIILGEKENSNTSATVEKSQTISTGDRRSGLDRRESRGAVYEKKERRSGAERRSGVDRRRQS